MTNTTLQKLINTTNNVHDYNAHSTTHASKQALYNRMFHADNFTKYQPTGNETKFDLLVNFNIHKAITSYRLKRIGNINAYELLSNINHTVSREDLEQEVLLKFVELSESWDIDATGKVTFEDDTAMVEVFKAIDNYLYRFQTKHFKHLYIEIDNNIVDVSKVSALADYVSIDDLTNDLHLQGFLATLTEFDRNWTKYRLQGYSNKAIADMTQSTIKKIRCTETRVRRLWTEYDK